MKKKKTNSKSSTALIKINKKKTSSKFSTADQNITDLVKHETKRDSLIKFTLLFLVLITYLIFVSLKFGHGQGFLITLLTWSFFVFCTPVADAGFLLDFPIRLITKIRMMHSEIAVWIIAFFINLYAFMVMPQIYQNTFLLKLFYHIIVQPFPYWSIILISGIGTFFSIHFGDEIMDVAIHSKRKEYHKHISKYQLILFIFIIVLIVILYDFLLKKMGINIYL